MANWIRSPRIQKLGLALAGFTEYIHPHRVQILGGSEINYLQILKPAAKKAALDGLSGLGICCIVITRGLEPPEGLLKLSIPVLGTSFQSSVSIARITVSRSCVTVWIGSWGQEGRTSSTIWSFAG